MSFVFEAMIRPNPESTVQVERQGLKTNVYRSEADRLPMK
jgi:hypothetical protein